MSKKPNAKNSRPQNWAWEQIQMEGPPKQPHSPASKSSPYKARSPVGRDVILIDQTDIKKYTIIPAIYVRYVSVKGRESSMSLVYECISQNIKIESLKAHICKKNVVNAATLINVHLLPICIEACRALHPQSVHHRCSAQAPAMYSLCFRSIWRYRHDRLNYRVGRGKNDPQSTLLIPQTMVIDRPCSKSHLAILDLDDMAVQVEPTIQVSGSNMGFRDVACHPKYGCETQSKKLAQP